MQIRQQEQIFGMKQLCGQLGSSEADTCHKSQCETGQRRLEGTTADSERSKTSIPELRLLARPHGVLVNLQGEAELRGRQMAAVSPDVWARSKLCVCSRQLQTGLECY